MRKNKGKRKKHRSQPKFDSIIAAVLDVWYSCAAYTDVQYNILLSLLHFCLGRCPCLGPRPSTSHDASLSTFSVEKNAHFSEGPTWMVLGFAF